jgi:hypothetical protein
MIVDLGVVTRAEVFRATEQYDRVRPEKFFAEHGFAPTTTYDLVWKKRRYRLKQSWAPLMNSLLAIALPPPISKVARAGP